MGNISYRLGVDKPINEIREIVKGEKGLAETYERLDNHLYANRIDLKNTPLILGPVLTFDQKSERFKGAFAKDANKLVKPEYRKPFVIPEKF